MGEAGVHKNWAPLVKIAYGGSQWQAFKPLLRFQRNLLPPQDGCIHLQTFYRPPNKLQTPQRFAVVKTFNGVMNLHRGLGRHIPLWRFAEDLGRGLHWYVPLRRLQTSQVSFHHLGWWQHMMGSSKNKCQNSRC